MGDFKFSMKSITAAALITVCAAVAFWGLGQNEKSVDNKNQPADFSGHAGSQPPAGRILHAIGKEPVMPKGFNPNAAWRDPFAAPAEITGTRPQGAQDAPPSNTPEVAGGGFNPQGLPSSPHTADLPSLAGIVSSGSRQMAIIRHNGVSRAYNEGEQVGDYRLAQIAGNEVILENHAGKLTVRLP